MVKKFKTYDIRPSVVKEQGKVVTSALTNEAKLSLYKKSQKSGISTDILEKVYFRGYSIWNESFGQTAEQFAFDRVNSFISGGFASQLDDDLLEGVGDMFGGARDSVGIKKHLSKNGYVFKRSGGSHEIWHKPSDPSASHISIPNHRGDHPPGTIRSMYKQYNSKNTNESIEHEEPITKDKNKSSSRFVGTKSLVKIFQKETPGQSVTEQRIQTIKNIIRSKNNV